jgi:hypothetical protein
MAVAYDIAPGPSVADVARESLEDRGTQVAQLDRGSVAIIKGALS